MSGGERAPHASLKKTRFDKGPKQYTADLAIETGHPRSLSGGELHDPERARAPL